MEGALFGGAFAGFFLLIMALTFVPLVFCIYALVEAVRAPEQAYGPPWDNSKNAWVLGLALSFVIPFGTIVGPILWWMNGHKALRARTVVPRPFWAPAPRYYPPPPGAQMPPPGPVPPQPYGQQPPQGPPQPPYGG
jgi:hypothetical protein